MLNDNVDFNWESGPLSDVNGILDVLMYRAIHEGDKPAFTYLADGTAVDLDWNYAQLASATLWVRNQLPENAEGLRVLLIFEPGLAFLAAYLGVMAAGAVAVPCHPPMGNTQIQRMLGMIMDCQPQIVMHSKYISDHHPQLKQFTQAAEQFNIKLLELDIPRDPLVEPETFAQFQGPAPEQLAMLQYTSASTGDPKGVMINHANLMANCEAIYDWLGPDPQRKGCIWLPPYHDMGLLGGIMQPLFAGFPLVFMSPLHFIQSPLRWLKTLSNFKGSITGAPNFAFRMCVEQITDEQLEAEGIDLSCVREIFCGSEPIHATTMQSFAQRFEHVGFKHEAINPCYGMAEATLLVSGKPKNKLPNYVHFDKESLEQGTPKETDINTTDAKNTLELVSCGHVAKGLDIRVVDPDTGSTLPSGQVGEIWVRGNSMSEGYWRKPEINELAFKKQPQGEDNTDYYTTGDMGFIHEGEVFVTGRIKDLIIVRGRNLYPQDIERACLNAHPALKQSIAAAFALQDGEEEGIGIIVELKKEQRAAEDEIKNAIESAIRQHFQVTPSAIYFGPPRTVLRTTSGKIRRSACRDAYLKQKLKQFPEAAVA